MARLPRIYIKGILYYITCRGMHNQNIFKDNQDYQMFLELLSKYQQQYGIKLFSFVLLPGHLHLLLEVTGDKDDISGFMHSLNNSYTKYFNSRYQRKGHLFRGRFKAALVEKDPNLAKLTAYMHLNPKRLNLVFDAKDYPYSSYKHYLNPQTDKLFNLEQEISEVLSLLAGRGYQELVEELTKDGADRLHKQLQRQRIIGSDEFVKRIKREAVNLQSRSVNGGLLSKQPRYRLYILAGGFLLMLVAGLSSVYFYFMARDSGMLGDKQEMITQAIRRVKELDTTEWTVSLTPVLGGKQVIDTLNFIQGKFVSGRLNTQGYSSSNYSLTIEDSGKIIWETMQTGTQGSASWRGEIEGDKMQGILSLRSGNQTQDFSFISIKQRRKR